MSGPTSTCVHDHKRSPSWIASRLRFVSASDPRVNDSQRMEMCLRRDVPDLARYLLAESISTDAVARDPRSFRLDRGPQPGLARLAAALARAAAGLRGRARLRDPARGTHRAGRALPTR